MGKAKQQIEEPEATLEAASQDDAVHEHARQKDDGQTRVRRMAVAHDEAHDALPSADRARAARLMQQSVGNARTNQASGALPGKMRDEALKKVSTPVGDGAKLQKGGSFKTETTEATITVLPDARVADTQLGADGETTFTMNWGKPSYLANREGVITKVTLGAKPTFTIQTRYRKGANPAGPSAYGVGTRPDDALAGTTTLRHHEASHGSDYLTYLAANPLPVFGGKVGMTVEAFKAEVVRYDEAMEPYRAAMEAYSKAHTDCVGTPGDDCAPTTANSP